MKEYFLLLIITTLFPMHSAVKVINLQPGGNYSTNSYIKLENFLQDDLENFTVCAWLNLDYMRDGWRFYFFSYAYEGNDNEFTGCK